VTCGKLQQPRNRTPSSSIPAPALAQMAAVLPSGSQLLIMMCPSKFVWSAGQALKAVGMRRHRRL